MSPCVLVEDPDWLYYCCTVRSTATASPNIGEANFYPPGELFCDSIDQIAIRIGDEDQPQFAVREIKFNPPIEDRETWEYAFTVEEYGCPDKFTSCDVQCRFGWRKIDRVSSTL